MKKFLCTLVFKTTIITLVLGFFIQTISLFPFYAFASTLSNFEEIQKLHIGSAITARGKIIKSEGAGQEIEMKLEN